MQVVQPSPGACVTSPRSWEHPGPPVSFQVTHRETGSQRGRLAYLRSPSVVSRVRVAPSVPDARSLVFFPACLVDLLSGPWLESVGGAGRQFSWGLEEVALKPPFPDHCVTSVLPLPVPVMLLHPCCRPAYSSTLHLGSWLLPSVLTLPLLPGPAASFCSMLLLSEISPFLCVLPPCPPGLGAGRTIKSSAE